MSDFPRKRTAMTRIRVIMAVLSILVGSILIFRLFWLQIVKGDEYKQMALNQQLKDTVIEPHRGSIYDKNFKTLATSKTVWDVVLEPANMSKDPEKKENELKILCDPEKGLPALLGISEEEIREKATKVNSFWQVLTYKADKDTADAVEALIKENKIKCLTLNQNTKRVYPFNDLAASVLGFVNSYDNRGAYGLEAYYNKVLTGKEGRILSARNGQNGEMPFQYEKLYESQDGNSLVLTIDQVLQQFLENHLEVAVSEHEVKERALGIIMDVDTGEVLAMSSKPDFDPNNPRQLMDKQAVVRMERQMQFERQKEQGVSRYNITPLPVASVKDEDLLDENLEARAKNLGMTDEEFSEWILDERNKQWRNKAISDPYEPGSVFKLLTASAALDTGSVTFDSTFYCPGYKEVAGNKIHCWNRRGHGTQNLVDAVKHSCNPSFIEIGQRTGIENFTTYFDRFGLTDLTGIDLPGEATGIYHSKDTMGIAELSSSAFGQTFKVSGIQLITALSASLNGGNLMQPYIVKEIIDSDHNIVETTQPKVKRQVISEKTSQQICYLGEQVVGGGYGASGRNAAIPGYRIGGKTGTSEKLDNFDENGRQFGNVLSFVGFAPADDPKVAVLVALDEPVVGDAQSSTIAAPIVGAILEDVLPYLGIEPSNVSKHNVGVGSYVGGKPHEVQIKIRRSGLKTQIIGNGPSVLKQIPAPGKTLPYGGTVILYTDQSEADNMSIVPNVVGDTLSDANLKLTNSGFNVNIAGYRSGKDGEVVLSQDPPAGETRSVGTIVRIKLGKP